MHKHDSRYCVTLHVRGSRNNSGMNLKRFINTTSNCISSTTADLFSFLVIANFVGSIWCSNGTDYIRSDERCSNGTDYIRSDERI